MNLTLPMPTDPAPLYEALGQHCSRCRWAVWIVTRPFNVRTVVLAPIQLALSTIVEHQFPEHDVRTFFQTIDDHLNVTHVPLRRKPNAQGSDSQTAAPVGDSGVPAGARQVG